VSETADGTWVVLIVCVYERGRERERECVCVRVREWGGVKLQLSWQVGCVDCVCVCVCGERERE